MAATFHAFEQLRKEYEHLLEVNLAKVSNEDLDYWTEQANKEIRGPVRAWLAEALTVMQPDHRRRYLQGLPKDWRPHTEVLFAYLKATEFPFGAPVTGAPVIPAAPEMKKNNVWEKWLADFEEATGQEWVPPYKQRWRPGWGTAAAAAGVVGAALAFLRPWR